MVVRRPTNNARVVIVRLLILITLGVSGIGFAAVGAHRLAPDTHAFLYMFIGLCLFWLFSGTEAGWRSEGKLDVRDGNDV